MKHPIRVAVTGAAGQIGYALLFRIASGEMLGKDQPVILQMLELPLDKAQAALKGVMMELEDCAFPLLAGMVGTDDPRVAFGKTHAPSGLVISNDVDFCNVLLETKGVACVPGSAFGAPSALRISYTCPTPQLAPGLQRFQEFFAKLQ